MHEGKSATRHKGNWVKTHKWERTEGTATRQMRKCARAKVQKGSGGKGAGLEFPFIVGVFRSGHRIPLKILARPARK